MKTLARHWLRALLTDVANILFWLAIATMIVLLVSVSG